MYKIGKCVHKAVMLWFHSLEWRFIVWGDWIATLWGSELSGCRPGEWVQKKTLRKTFYQVKLPKFMLDKVWIVHEFQIVNEEACQCIVIYHKFLIDLPCNFKRTVKSDATKFYFCLKQKYNMEKWFCYSCSFFN